MTGAGGFLGRRVVDAAIEAGHEVVAMVRPTATVDLGTADVVRGDLRRRGPWSESLGPVDAVVHLAAATSGDLSEQFAGTVVATENVLAALPLAALSRFVHVSTIAVYDFAALPAHATVDESTPLEPSPDRRDPYTETKLLQERLVRSVCEEAGVPLAVLRPGAVYGPDKDWGLGVATRVGPVGLLFSPDATPPLTYVDNCADAIVAAIDAPGAAGVTCNVVDDEPPTYARFLASGREHGIPTGPVIPVPWRLVDALGRVLALIGTRFTGGAMKLPEVLVHRRQQARWKPLRFPNGRARCQLGWAPRVTFDEAMARIAGSP